MLRTCALGPRLLEDDQALEIKIHKKQTRMENLCQTSFLTVIPAQAGTYRVLALSARCFRWMMGAAASEAFKNLD